MTELATRINELMAQQGRKVGDLHKAIGVSYEMARRYTLGTAIPRDEKIEAMATYFGVSPAYLKYGTADTDRSGISVIERDFIQSEQDLLHKHRIDYLDVRAAAGLVGFENSDYPEIISSLYLTDEGILQIVGKKNANGICIVNVPTDSMEPTIRKGDIVFIDTKINAYSGDGIYAFTLDGALFIKRIQKLIGGGYRLHSDNKENYDPQDITDEVYQNAKFIGRFVRTVHIEAVNL